MGVLPVIQRELRVASRQRATWRLRVSFAAAAVLASGVGLLLPDVALQRRGQTLLICLAIASFTLALFAGAFLTADCVSVEKRDGTLGLLFLTPLNGWEIVLGKMATHSMQAGTAWLATIPAFFLPLLQGGVTSAEIGRLLLALLVAQVLSLATGLFWSTIVLEARTSVMATLVTMLTLTLLPWAPRFVKGVFLGRGFQHDALALLSPMTAVIHAFESAYMAPGRAGTPGAWPVYWTALATGVALGLFLLGLSGWLLARLWRQAEAGGKSRLPGPRSTRRRASRENAGRRLWAGQPCHWIASRGLGSSVGLRFIQGSVLLGFVAMLMVSVITRHGEAGFSVALLMAYVGHLIGRVHAAMATTRRFHDDRRSGALELMLVTPVADGEVIAGHDAALRRALRELVGCLVGMNVVLQAMVVLFADQLHLRSGGPAPIFSVFSTGGIVLVLADFAALRWMGPRHALRASSHLKAAGRSLAVLMLPPYLGFIAAFLFAIQFREAAAAAVVFALWMLGCVLYDAALIHSARRWLRVGIRRRAAEPT